MGWNTPSGLSNEVPAVGGRYPLVSPPGLSSQTRLGLLLRRRWGVHPPLLVYRASLPPLGGGTPLLVLRVYHHKLVLVFFSAAVGGFIPPYWFIEHRFRRWGAVPPGKVTDDPWSCRIKSRQIECVQVLGVCDSQAV